MPLNPLLKRCEMCDFSNTGYVFTFAGGAVLWKPKFQNCVALSTTEVEYIEVVEVGKEMLWIKKIIRDFELSPSLSSPSHSKRLE